MARAVSASASAEVTRLTGAVLARVGRPFPVEPIRTLDAVHLATAEELAEPPALVTIMTRDARSETTPERSATPSSEDGVACALRGEDRKGSSFR
jgi:hypothetical protein